MAQLNWQILTQDSAGNPVGGVRVTATLVGGPPTTTVGVQVSTTDAIGIAKFGFGGISHMGPYEFAMSFADAPGALTAPDLPVSIGIGNDADQDPPYVVTMTGDPADHERSPAPQAGSGSVSVAMATIDARSLLASLTSGGTPSQDVAKHVSDAIVTALQPS